METYYFQSYKISDKLPLEKIKSYFNVSGIPKRQEYIALDNSKLGIVFNYQTAQKLVYIFSYGCISFLNFEEGEIYSFLSVMEHITGKIDFNMFSTYNERHVIKVDDDGNSHLWATNNETIKYRGYFNHIVCMIMAKSLELYKLETELKSLLDNAEKYLSSLQKAKLKINKKDFINSISKILRFEYRIIYNIKVFERYNLNLDYIESKKVYTELSGYYELDSRYVIVKNKTDDLRGIFKRYSSLSYRQNMNRLLVFEIILLALFPTFYFVENFNVKEAVVKFLGFFFSK